MLPALLTVLGATTVSLTVDAGLRCPAPASLTERLARVGLNVLAPKAPVTERLAAAFEVSVKPTPDGLQVEARRAADGRLFQRAVQPGQEDCPTVERLVAVLIHSWISTRMPVVGPQGAQDGGKR